MATLYIVATPIGNLEDITLRAIRTLKEADVIVCEDTRVTGKLLKHHSIAHGKLGSMNARTEEKKIEKVTGLLEEGKSVALVTDAGTPALSDPGTRLTSAVRAAGYDVIAIPGPSALTAALSVAGVPSSEFLFLGFLPHKKGRETLFKEIAGEKRTVIFYESPHRIEKTLQSLAQHASGKAITLCRELTKMHEEVLAGSAEEILEHLRENPEKIRGEFVVLVAPR